MVAFSVSDRRAGMGNICFGSMILDNGCTLESSMERIGDIFIMNWKRFRER